MLLPIILYLLGFAGMWFGAGLAIKPLTRLAKKLRFSAFNLSFIILGIATSVGEFSVGVNSLLVGDMEIFIGNILGANIVLFLLIIPLLALLGGHLQIDHELRGSRLVFILGVIAIPVLVSFDGVITKTDAGFAFISFWFLLFIIKTKASFVKRVLTPRLPLKSLLKELGLSLVGVVIIFLASRLVVSETLYFAEVMEISPFILSLILISLGTNLPEIIIGLRSIFLRQKSLALADYMGSASCNTMLFGLFGLMAPDNILLTNSYWIPLTTLILGLTVFMVFAKSNNKISLREAVILLLIYIGFLMAEVLK